MPFINVKTNVKVSPQVCSSIKSELGKAITAISGKSENWLMVGIEPDYILYFKGSDSPAAMAEVSIFGQASRSELENLTGKICAVLSKNLSVSSDRIYVKYSQTPDWGWNGSNF